MELVDAMKVFCFQCHIHVLATDEDAAGDFIAETFAELHTARPDMPDWNDPRIAPSPRLFELKEVGEVTTQ